MTVLRARGHSSSVTLAVLAGSPSATAPGQPLVTERPSFETVYEENFDFVWRSLRRLGVPRSQVDDAVQEVFLVVHRRLDDFEGRSLVRTWLFGIAFRVARTLRRTRGRREAEPLDDHEVGCTAPTPADRTEQAEAARLVYRLLERLDEDKRAVFILSELEEMTASEISEALGININTVYSRLRAARRGFEAALVRHRVRTEQRGPT